MKQVSVIIAALLLLSCGGGGGGDTSTGSGPSSPYEGVYVGNGSFGAFGVPELHGATLTASLPTGQARVVVEANGHIPFEPDPPCTATSNMFVDANGNISGTARMVCDNCTWRGNASGRIADNSMIFNIDGPLTCTGEPGQVDMFLRFTGTRS